MDKAKLILNIDGPRGVGKTTQIGLLSRYFKEKDLKVHANVKLIYENSVMVERMENSVKMLDKEFDVIINEGSFLRMLAEDLMEGMNQIDLFENNRDLVNLNEKTRHSHQTLNIIMKCEELDALLARLEKHARLTETKVELFDDKKEAEILKRMLGFEKSMLTLNTNTKVLDVPSELKVLEVNDYLKEIISSFLQSS